NPVIAPELLAAENADRNAEDLILLALLLRLIIFAAAVALEISAIVRAGHAKRLDEAFDRVDLVNREFPAEEQLIDETAVFEQAALLLRKQTADERRRRLEDFQRAADDLLVAPLVRCSPRVHVGILDLVFRIDAALSGTLDPELERAPLHLD